MSGSDVVIIGAGMMGTAVAHKLARKGIKVTLLEKGPEYPYPHAKQFKERVLYHFNNPEHHFSKDLKNHVFEGRYDHNLEHERYMRVGGSGTMWEGITVRMRPEDFRLKSTLGVGSDWLVSYKQLEPYYGESERFMGVSGTDEDNPFAPPRSTPYPMPPFELSYGDKILVNSLKKIGIQVHTTPQARNRKPYDDRAVCVNYGMCNFCPIGARYSPNFHISRLLDEGLITLRTDVSVKRITLGPDGRANGVILQENDGSVEEELAANCVVVAAGGFESPRLLLLSKNSKYPDGLGNQGGQVGKNLVFHHIWRGGMRFTEALYPGRFDGWTGQSQQFLSPEGRGSHGGCKVEFTSHQVRDVARVRDWTSGETVVEDLEPVIYWRAAGFHCETVPGNEKFLALSGKKDRFGDPFVKISYQLSDFDHETYRYTEKLMERFVQGTGAVEHHFSPFESFDTGSHHMGSCRMGDGPGTGTVNEFGQVHGIKNLFVTGGPVFAGTSGSINPTLTMMALAFRTADYILDKGVHALSS